MCIEQGRINYGRKVLWIFGVKGFSCVVKIVGGCEAYIYDRWDKEYRRNDCYLNAMYDSGSEYDELTKEKSEEIIRSLYWN